MPHPHRSYDDEGDGLAVILLHGYPFNRSMWREQIDFLSARGYRVVAPDLFEMSEPFGPTQTRGKRRCGFSCTRNDLAHRCARRRGGATRHGRERRLFK